MRTQRRNVERSRELRQSNTQEELRLWPWLRTRPLGFKFRRQHQVGPFIVDFVCPAAGLIVEIDGGGHASFEQRRYDAERTEFLEARGWRVIRFWNFQVHAEFEAVLQVIVDALLAPHPGPLPAAQGEGER